MIKDIGNRIAEIRMARGLTQDELAELSTLSRISIARYETGKIEPGAKALGRIADALEVSSDILLGRLEEQAEAITTKNEPRTAEARSISGAIDRMPKEERVKAESVMRTLYEKYFEDGKEKTS